MYTLFWFECWMSQYWEYAETLLIYIMLSFLYFVVVDEHLGGRRLKNMLLATRQNVHPKKQSRCRQEYYSDFEVLIFELLL